MHGTTSVLLIALAGRGAVVRREAACGIAADNLLTGWAVIRGREPARDPLAR
jgi:hypothetical protein